MNKLQLSIITAINICVKLRIYDPIRIANTFATVSAFVR